MTADRTAAGARRAGSLERVREWLSGHGLDDRIRVFEPGATRTCEMAAAAVGCDVGQIVKSLVFVTAEGPVLALVAGDRRGDAAAIAAEMGAPKARFADAETVRTATGYAIGGVSPFDLPDGLRVLMDRSLERFDTVWTAAGTPESMVWLETGWLAEMTRATVADVGAEVEPT